MNPADRGNFAQDQPFNHHEFDSLIDGDLACPCRSPDLTESIMRRLGYERTARCGRHRVNWQRWGRRLSVAAAAGVALFVGIVVHQASSDARHASDLSIPSAIQNDLQRHERSVGQLIRTIRQWTPTMAPRNPDPSADHSLTDDSPSMNSDRPATGPTMDPAAIAPFQRV